MEASHKNHRPHIQVGNYAGEKSIPKVFKITATYAIRLNMLYIYRDANSQIFHPLYQRFVAIVNPFAGVSMPCQALNHQIVVYVNGLATLHGKTE